MNPRGREIDHCDWKPLAVPKGYRDHYDEIKWSSPLIKTQEEVPYHVGCGGECDVNKPSYKLDYNLDLYKCRKCGIKIYDEEGRIEWKQRP